MGQAQFGHRRTCAHSAPQARPFNLRNRVVAFAALAFSLLLAGEGQAQTLASLPNSRPIDNTGAARPVLGWVKFCERHPDECRVDVSEPAVVAMTPQVWRSIVLVNRRVNGRIKPMTDKEHWGTVDSWNFPTTATATARITSS